MEKLAVGILLFAGAVFFAPLLGVLGGAFSGWVLSMFGFEPVVLGFLRALGADTTGMALWHVGAAMGFLGGFLKTNVTSSKSSD